MDHAYRSETPALAAVAQRPFERPSHQNDSEHSWRSEMVGGSFAIPLWINDDVAAAGVAPDVTDPEPGG